MIAGGGTGGHVYPALAIAREFVAREPGRRAVFVGTVRGLESRIVPAAGFPLETIDVGGLKGKSAGETIRNLIRLPFGFAGAWRAISRHQPTLILGVGGYSSGPVAVAGGLRRIPTMIHEQNAFPGVTNRVLARFVTEVAVAWEDATPRLGGRGIVTGNPVRQEFFDATREPLSVRGSKIRVLVFGGSQGSRILNDTMSEALMFLAKFRDRLDIVHQTGPSELDKVRAAYHASAFPAARVVPYLDAMADEMLDADLVVSRSGAMTIGELCASGRGAILVPFARATNNHQEVNARVVEKAGGAVVLLESELTPERLAGTISSLLGTSERTEQMGNSARRLSAPNATKEIVDIIDRIQSK